MKDISEILSIFLKSNVCVNTATYKLLVNFPQYTFSFVFIPFLHSYNKLALSVKQLYGCISFLEDSSKEKTFCVYKHNIASIEKETDTQWYNFSKAIPIFITSSSFSKEHYHQNYPYLLINNKSILEQYYNQNSDNLRDIRLLCIFSSEYFVTSLGLFLKRCSYTFTDGIQNAFIRYEYGENNTLSIVSMHNNYNNEMIDIPQIGFFGPMYFRIYDNNRKHYEVNFTTKLFD